MIRTVTKELHTIPLSENKHEHKTVTATMNTKYQQPQRQKKGYQQWILAISLAAFVVLILSRNQDSQNILLDTDLELATEETVHPKIRQISILGERNSGTRWTFEYVPYITFRLLECILPCSLLDGLAFTVGKPKLTFSCPNSYLTAIFQSVSATL